MIRVWPLPAQKSRSVMPQAVAHRQVSAMLGVELLEHLRLPSAVA